MVVGKRAINRVFEGRAKDRVCVFVCGRERKIESDRKRRIAAY